jgi:hypothetical protein
MNPTIYPVTDTHELMRLAHDSEQYYGLLSECLTAGGSIYASYYRPKECWDIWPDDDSEPFVCPRCKHATPISPSNGSSPGQVVWCKYCSTSWSITTGLMLQEMTERDDVRNADTDWQHGSRRQASDQ